MIPPIRRHGLLVQHQLLAFAALLVLATSSLVIGRMLDQPAWELPIALFIATVKAVLVLWFFMHLAEEPFRARLATLLAVLLVALLVALTTLDVVTRDVSVGR